MASVWEPAGLTSSLQVWLQMETYTPVPSGVVVSVGSYN